MHAYNVMISMYTKQIECSTAGQVYSYVWASGVCDMIQGDYIIIALHAKIAQFMLGHK